MKRFFKWFGISLGIVVALIGVLLLYINFAYNPTYEVNIPTIRVEATSARLERGRMLVMTLCAECHRDPVTRQLTGRRMGDLPEIFGTAYSRNITKDPINGIGAWSDGEIIWLIRTGIHPKTHKFVPPWMVKLTGIADEDLYSIVAFLRSDDPIVAPASTQNRQSEASLFAKVLTFAGAFKPFEYPKEAIALPDTTDHIAYGRYLANGVFACYECHSADFASNDRVVPTNSVGFYGGGNKTTDYEKLIVPSRNITPDKVHGIGSWTEEQFVSTMKNGFRPNGQLLRYPMVRLSHLSDFEIRAMYQYLRTIPALANPVADAQKVALDANSSRGKQLFNSYGCVHCHGNTGLGYADLQLAHKKYPGDDLLINFIKNPETVYPGTVMPTWEGRIPDQDLVEIAHYVQELGKSSGR